MNAIIRRHTFCSLFVNARGLVGNSFVCRGSESGLFVLVRRVGNSRVWRRTTFDYMDEYDGFGGGW